MFICCSNCLFIWAYQSLYIQCTMQMTKLDPTVINIPDGFLLPIKFDLGRSVHHIRRVVGVFTLHHKHWALLKKIPPGKYHLVVLVSQTNKQTKLIIYIEALRMTVELFLRLFFH